MTTDEAIAWLQRCVRSPHGDPLIMVSESEVSVYRDWRAFEDGNTIAVGASLGEAIASIVPLPDKQTACGERRAQDCVCGDCEVLS